MLRSIIRKCINFCCPAGVILRCLWQGQMARRNTKSKSHGKFGKHQSRSAEKVRKDSQPITACLNMRMIKNMACCEISRDRCVRLNIMSRSGREHGWKDLSLGSRCL